MHDKRQLSIAFSSCKAFKINMILLVLWVPEYSQKQALGASFLSTAFNLLLPGDPEYGFSSRGHLLSSLYF